ncbi:unnamed protein product [Anisakis simplex]|uniref:RING-type domain-containing protein n=1 Tax=Anisakis simplex TaxID=6269 RepID=A0A0M3JXS6_ANISI|nr:unnamed protein product [Anisakis simplex]
MDASTSGGLYACDSDYCTWSTASSEDDPELRRLASDTDSTGSGDNLRIKQDGHCPNCFNIIHEGVILDCGHWLCSDCNDCLTELCNNERRSSRRRRIRMGVTAGYCSPRAFPLSTPSKSPLYSDRNENIPVYSSPRCPLCGEPPKLIPPKRYNRVDDLLSEDMHSETIIENPLYSGTTKCYDNAAFDEMNIARYRNQTISTINHYTQFNTHFSVDRTTEQIINDAKIITCHIAILGARRSGKSCLAKRQFLNEVFFGENDDEINSFGSSMERRLSSLSSDRSCEGIRSRFMIEIIDTDDLHSNMSTADAFMLIYSVTDRNSLFEAINLHQRVLKTRGDEMPMVIVGTKADVDKKLWQVSSYEGQSFARYVGCPFVEVSAKNNDRVHQVYHLIRLSYYSLHPSFKLKYID